MKALSRSRSIDIGQYAELVLLLTPLLYLFYCYMLFSVCLYKPQINIITIFFNGMYMFFFNQLQNPF